MSDTGHTPHHYGHRTPSRPKSVAARSLPELAAPEETASKSDTLAVLKRLRSVREKGRETAPRRGLAAFLPSRLFDHANRHAARDEAPADEEYQIDPASLLGPRESASAMDTEEDGTGSASSAFQAAEPHDTDAPEDHPDTGADPAAYAAPGGDAAGADPAATYGMPFIGYGWAAETDLRPAPSPVDDEGVPAAEDVSAADQEDTDASAEDHADAWDAPVPADMADEMPEGEIVDDPAAAEVLDAAGADERADDEDMHAEAFTDLDEREAWADDTAEYEDTVTEESGTEADDAAALAILNEVAAQISVEDAVADAVEEPVEDEAPEEPASAFLIPNEAEEPVSAFLIPNEAGEPVAEVGEVVPQDATPAEIADEADTGASDPWDSLIAAALDAGRDDGEGEVDDIDEPEPAAQSEADVPTPEHAETTEDPWSDAIRAFAIDDAATMDPAPEMHAAEDAEDAEDAEPGAEEPETAQGSDGLDVGFADDLDAADDGSDRHDETDDGDGADDMAAVFAEADETIEATAADEAPEADFEAETDAAQEADALAGWDADADEDSARTEDPEWSMSETAPEGLFEDTEEDTAAIDGATELPPVEAEEPEALDAASAADEDDEDVAETAEIEATDAYEDEYEDEYLSADEVAGWSFEEDDDAEMAGSDPDAGESEAGMDADVAAEALSEVGDDSADAIEAAWMDIEAVSAGPEAAPGADVNTDQDLEEDTAQHAWGLETEAVAEDETPDPEAALAHAGNAEVEADAELAEETRAQDDMSIDAYGADFDEASDAERSAAEDMEDHSAEAEAETQNAVLAALADEDADADDDDISAHEPQTAAHVTPLRVPAVAADLRTADELDTLDRKPRIALMGEFSAGKSTLSNLLIGANPLPTKVTATQLPPVWISYGDGQPYREDIDGETHPIAPEELAYIDPARTRMVRLFARSETLELCDIIDMPGISDPNMASEVWERMIGKADGVIWCTHATQAWRQSEAAVWETLDPALHAKSLLLVTRFDKLLSDKDRSRVLKRLQRETEGLFRDCLPISLLDALTAKDDQAKWDASGAEAFTGALQALLNEMSDTLGQPRRARPGRPLSQFAPSHHAFAGDEDDGEDGARTPSRIAPRRIVPRRVSQDAAGFDPTA